jgi:hypothetical protein
MKQAFSFPKETWGLVAVSILLFLITYIKIELPQRKLAESIKKEQQLFDEDQLGAMKSLKLPNVIFHFTTDGVLLGEERIETDPERLEILFNLLDSLVVSRRLDSFNVNEPLLNSYLGDHPVSLSFEFENDKLEFRIGKKLDYEDGFYVFLVKSGSPAGSLLVVNDTTPQTSPLPEDVFRLNPYKYEKALRTVELPAHFFENKFIFNSKMLGQTQTVSFSNWRNRAFSLNLVQRATLPPAYPGIKYYDPAINDYLGNLLKLKAKIIFYQIDVKLLKNKMADVNLGGEVEAAEKIQIFNNYGSLDGIFVWTSFKPDRLYEIDHSVEKILMPNLQDFWDRRPLNNALSADEFTGTKEEFFSVAFPQGGEQKLKIPLGPNFLVARQDDRTKPMPNHQTFVNLFNTIINQADMLSLLEIDESKLLQQAWFELSYAGTRLFLTEVDGVLTFIDPDRKIKFHYSDSELLTNIGRSFTDYFFL